MNRNVWMTVLSLASASCGGPLGSFDASASDASADRSLPPDTECRRDALESDLSIAPLSGAGVDATGALRPGSYVISTTYLRLQTTADAERRFGAVMGPITEALRTEEGLVGLSIATSVRCATARTLSVWRDEASMLRFVVGSAHAAAVNAVSTISRGGSVTSHWSGGAADATWQRATQTLANHAGRQY